MHTGRHKDTQTGRQIDVAAPEHWSGALSPPELYPSDPKSPPTTFLVLTNLGSFDLETCLAEQVRFYSKGQHRFVTDRHRQTDFAARAHRHSNHRVTRMVQNHYQLLCINQFKCFDLGTSLLQAWLSRPSFCENLCLWQLPITSGKHIKHYMGLDTTKPVFRGANNKGADQSAHSRRLISAFVILFVESILSKLARSKISSF